MAANEPPLPRAGSNWLDLLERAHDLLGPRIDARATARTSDMLETFEQQMKPRLQPIMARILADPAIPNELRPLLEILHVPENSLDSIAIGVAIGAIIGPVLNAAITPLLQVLVNSAWQGAAALGPTGSVRPTPEVLASAVLKGVLLQPDAAGIATNYGIDSGDFDTLVQTAGQSIGLEEALLLYRRGQITADNPNGPIPGLKQIIEYSNINPRFYPLPELLQYVPISVGEIVAANLKGHLPDGDAVTLLKKAGINGDEIVTPGLTTQQLLRASAGRPPGIQEMLELRNRHTAGLITTVVDDAVIKQTVEQSDINDAYLPYVYELGKYFPPPRSVVPMLRAKAINPTQARQLLEGYGVQEPFLTAFVTEGTTSHTGKVKELGTSQILALYEAAKIDGPTATARLEALTYSAADAADLVALADEKKVDALQNATTRMVGSRYVARKITQAEATNALGAAGVPAPAQALAFKYWDIERTVSVHVPTPAQVIGAFRRGDIDGAECRTRLLALGVDATDLHILIADGFPPTHPNPQATAIAVAGRALYVNGLSTPPGGGNVKQETVKQIQQLYVARAIDRPTAITRLEALGYSAAQAGDLVTLAGPQIPAVP